MDAVWVQSYVAIAQVVVSGFIGIAQCVLIYVGLRQIRESSTERNRQLDRQDQMIQQQGKALENIGLGIQELLRRSS